MAVIWCRGGEYPVGSRNGAYAYRHRHRASGRAEIAKTITSGSITGTWIQLNNYVMSCPQLNQVIAEIQCSGQHQVLAIRHYVSYS